MSRLVKRLTIAIDGPAGAGKSTVARIVARRLGYTYIDSGAMYRALTLKALEEKVDLDDDAALTRLAEETDIILKYDPADHANRVYLDGRDISAAIRTPAVSRAVAAVAKVPGVRRQMVAAQRRLAAAGGVVMDGRDIGTHVLPNADVKIFLTASLEERAQRRYKELAGKGFPVDLDGMRRELSDRDRVDCEREASPLIPAPDAVFLDSTALTVEGVVEAVLKLCREA